MDILPDDPDHILMSLPTPSSLMNQSYAGVYRVNIHNQKMKLIQGSVDHVHSWMTDQQHRSRIGHYYDIDKGLHKVLVKRSAMTHGWSFGSMKLF